MANGFSTINQTANAIPFDNQSNGFVSTDTQAAIEEARSFGVLSTIFQSSATAVSTSSATFINVGADSTVTPPAGDYIITYTAFTETTGVNTRAEVDLALDGVQIADTLRGIRTTAAILGLVTLSTNNAAIPTAITTRLTLNGTQTISARIREISGGTIVIRNRALLLLRIRNGP